MSFEVILSLFVLMLVSIGTYFISQRFRLPYTVLLVLVGSLIVPLASLPEFVFLKAFHLTPELLFYIFLPILIFESAYSMRIRELMSNIRSVASLAVVSLLLSTVIIAGALFFLFQMIDMEVPFMVTLLFGALISATDPVAVLALFKEFGVPRRLSFLFEGESLFNDGTALALFLIILEIALKGFSGIETIFEGVFMFITMVFGGAVFGIGMGFVFAKLIEKARNNEHIEITLTLLVAHLTFILSEVISHHFVLFGQKIYLSAIIATVMASMVIGNYGRSKLSSRVEHFMERFWSYFAFLTNSLVFITMGLLFADLPIDFKRFIIPILLTMLVVVVARAFSIYPVVGWLNLTRKEKYIPMEWQHLLAWGSLRGALAIIMVLLIPESLSFPSWHFDYTVKEFITALTIGCIYFTLFVKALTIGPLIRYFHLDRLTPVEEAGYHQSRVFIFAYGLQRLAGFFSKGYLSDASYAKLNALSKEKRDRESRECEKILALHPEDFDRALRVYALGIEKYFLGLLFQYQEISESVYKHIVVKLDIQLERVAEGEVQSEALHEDFPPDWFEQIAASMRTILLPKKNQKHLLTEAYMYYRAQEIIARKVIKEFEKLKHRSALESSEYQAVVSQVIASYQAFYDDARQRTREVVAKNPEHLELVNEMFGRQSLVKAFEEGLNELTRKNMLSPKLKILLDGEFGA